MTHMSKLHILERVLTRFSNVTLAKRGSNSFGKNHAGDTGGAGALSVFICNDDIPAAESFAD
jgi:hypothetical protein